MPTNSMHTHKDSQQSDTHPVNVQFVLKIIEYDERKEKKRFDKSAKTNRTDIFHNLLNLDSGKDVQLLQS